MIGVFVYHDAAFQSVADVTMPSLRQYCQRHGYTLTIHCGGFGDRGRYYGFQKTELAQLLLRGVDALWVLDADTLITNFTIAVHTLIDSHHDVFAAHDVNGFNAGSYLIRNTDNAHFFLNAVGMASGRPGMDGEQPAMKELLDEGLAKFRQLPQNSINSYIYSEYGIDTDKGDWRKGDLLLHLPGRTNARRIELFTSPEIVDNIVR